MISWIIAAYNEEKRLPETLCRVAHELESMDLEIVVSDDGSRDRTYNVASTYAEVFKNVRIIANTHRGRGSALRSGFYNSKGEITVFSSADIWIRRNQVENLMKLLKDFDLILLSKHTPGSVGIHTSIARRLLSLSYNFLIRLLWKIPYGDTQGVKIGKVTALREIISRTRSDGFLFDLEIVVNAHELNYKVAEVPWTYSYSAGSKINVMSIFQMAFGLINLKLRSIGTREQQQSG